MAFNFPASPTIGQRYEPSPGISYYWTGQAWDREGQTSIPSKMPAGVVSPYAGTVLPPGALWCDGSTFDTATFPHLYAALGNNNRTPDLRGRAIIGKDNMGGTAANRVTNTGVGNSGIDGKTLFATGGFDRYTLAAVHIPAHTHTGSGTTSNVSADHTHWVAGRTGNDTVNHSHWVAGGTDAQGDHYHGTNQFYTGGAAGSVNFSATGPVANKGSRATDNAGSHAHNVAFSSGTVSAWHQHDFGVTSGGISVNHTHTYSFTSTSFGGGEAHPIMQPSMVLNWIIWHGE